MHEAIAPYLHILWLCGLDSLVGLTDEDIDEIIADMLNDNLWRDARCA